jgi:DtxR family transcriptional regulator, Mn-dependent transcriptional regulator
MPSSTVENYVKELYLQEQHAPGELVSLGKLARALGVLPGTVTTMIRTLTDAKLVQYEPRNGARLSPSGRKLALHVIRRHRLVELFLVRTLGFDWSEVHDEAEELEHVISDKLLERIDAHLGRPATDPHGDPIPAADGSLRAKAGEPITGLVAKRRGRLSRVLGADPALLQFLDSQGIRIGANLQVVENNATTGTVSVRVGRRESLALSTAIAEKLLVIGIE